MNRAKFKIIITFVLIKFYLTIMLRFWGLIFFFLFSFVISAQIDSSLNGSEKHVLFQINDSAYFFQQDSIQELWLLDNSANSWKLGHSTEIRTFYNNSFRLWLQGKSVSLWEYDKAISDWKLTKSFFPEVRKLNDTTSFISINDTTKLITIKGQKERKFSMERED